MVEEKQNSYYKKASELNMPVKKQMLTDICNL